MMLCMAVCMGMISGCGQKETMDRLEEAAQTVADLEDTGNAADSPAQVEEPEIKTATFSEYLGEGKKILYRIRNMDKDHCPEYIYCFENGWIMPVMRDQMRNTMEQLSLGDLSRMTDEEIWGKMEEYWESRYSCVSDALHQLEENKLMAGTLYMEHKEDDEDVESFAKRMLYLKYYRTGEGENDVWGLPAASTDEEESRKYWEERADYYPGGQEEVKNIGEEVCEKMGELMPGLHETKGGFPIAFIVQTDSTGNIVEEEDIVWIDSGMKAISTIEMVQKGGTGQIYDSYYDIYPGGYGYSICVRGDTEMIFDSTDNAGVYVDIPIGRDSISALFE